MFYEQFNVRAIVRCPTEKAVVILYGDGWHSAGFVEVEFLGRPLLFTSAAMRIARMTMAPVLPFFIPGSPGSGLRITIEEPIVRRNTVDPMADVEMMVKDYARRLEHHLMKNIPSWEHWLHTDVLESMTSWLDKSLDERYRV